LTQLHYDDPGEKAATSEGRPVLALPMGVDLHTGSGRDASARAQAAAGDLPKSFHSPHRLLTLDRARRLE